MLARDLFGSKSPIVDSPLFNLSLGDFKMKRSKTRKLNIMKAKRIQSMEEVSSTEWKTSQIEDRIKENIDKIKVNI